MTIRKYTDTDKDSVIELLRMNTPAYFAPEEEQGLIYYLHNHADNYFVVEVNDRILGCGGFNILNEGKLVRISWDIIHPQSQGRGIGTELTRFRLQKIKEMNGVETVSVRTSQLVYKFYEKFGFEIQEIVKNYWADGFDLYRLDCDIHSI
jgi:ribosomal protein S18 acetylase RimI-like enzyme